MEWNYRRFADLQKFERLIENCSAILLQSFCLPAPVNYRLQKVGGAWGSWNILVLPRFDAARGRRAKKLAEVHGNRTHPGRRSAPRTGFEVQESHQCPIHFRSV